MATAPPNSTANISSVCAPRMIWLLNTNRKLCVMLESTGKLCAAAGSAMRSVYRDTAALALRMAATR